VRVAIFDIKLANFPHTSTPQPSVYVMMLSGMHKQLGDAVSLWSEPGNFGGYDLVYLVKDGQGLLHSPRWLKFQNVKLVGDGWRELGHFDKRWQDYPLDELIYKEWERAWRRAYPSFTTARMRQFRLKPVLVYPRGRKIKHFPKDDLIICDKQLQKFDSRLSFLNQIHEGCKVTVLYPLVAEKGDISWMRECVFNNRLKIHKDGIKIMIPPEWSKEKLLNFMEEWMEFGGTSKIKFISPQVLPLADPLEVFKDRIEKIQALKEKNYPVPYYYFTGVRAKKYHLLLHKLGHWTFNLYPGGSFLESLLKFEFRNELMHQFLLNPSQYLLNGEKYSADSRVTELAEVLFFHYDVFCIMANVKKEDFPFDEEKPTRPFLKILFKNRPRLRQSFMVELLKRGWEYEEIED